MKTAISTLSAATLALALTSVAPPAQACNDKGNCDNAPGHHRLSGAPGPIVGAGLPVLAIGYGVYWLVRRRRKLD